MLGIVVALQWRHNGRDSVPNHQPHDCLLNRLFRRISEKTSKLRVTGLCAGNSPRIGEFPAQMASNADNVSIWWRHHGFDPCIYDGSTFILQNVRVQFRLAFWLWVTWILTEVCELLWRQFYCDWWRFNDKIGMGSLLDFSACIATATQYRMVITGSVMFYLKYPRFIT